MKIPPPIVFERVILSETTWMCSFKSLSFDYVQVIRRLDRSQEYLCHQETQMAVEVVARTMVMVVEVIVVVEVKVGDDPSHCCLG